MSREDVASFEAFFDEMHGVPPLRWQARLASEVAESGRWPSLIAVPTGLGKTACIDIAVWTLACQADDGAARSLPTRIWYVVNRRLLVDAAWDRAVRLSAALRHPAGRQAVHSVACALLRLRPTKLVGPESPPLEVTRLRGGVDLDPRPRDPAQPALLFATAPMFASRWLFSGYGVPRTMRPLEAALAGIDSLVLLDEAHLSQPLLSLGEPLAACDRYDTPVLAASRLAPCMVSMTATGQQVLDRFELGPDDMEPLVADRLVARKPLRVFDQAGKGRSGVAADLVAHAVELLGDQEGRSCLIFANSPRTAREVHTILAGRGASAILLTGRIRPEDARSIVDRLQDPSTGIPAGHDHPPAREPLFVVATQTLEVGADLSADSLVTELAGRRALIQRLGRVNRLGRQPWSQVRIVVPSEPTPLYANEMEDLARVLPRNEEIDCSPARVQQALGEPREDPPFVPALLPSLVWEWVKTSNPPLGAAAPEAYFDPQEGAQRRVSVCWRAYLPPDGDRLEPLVSARETVDLPLGELLDVLSGSVRRVARDQGSLEEVAADDLLAGDTVVLATSAGLYDEFGWNAESRAAVTDLSLARLSTLPIVAGLAVRLDSRPAVQDVLEELLASLGRLVSDRASLEDDLVQSAPDPDVCHVVGQAAKRLAVDEPGDTLWQDRLEAAAQRGELAMWPRLPGTPGRDDGPTIGLVLGSARRTKVPAAPPLLEVLDELSLGSWLEAIDPTSRQLTAHMDSVGDIASEIASALGLAAGVVATLRLAGRTHDAGKADGRFQRWLAGGVASGGLLAKSSYGRDRMEQARVAAGWPRGGRHETLSARAVLSWLAGNASSTLDPAVDRELLVHLVISHHGEGRPSMPVTEQGPSPDALIDVLGGGYLIDTDLSTPELSQPERFRRLCGRYGYWGLALLEAIVRQADHAASGVSGLARDAEAVDALPSGVR